MGARTFWLVLIGLSLLATGGGLYLVVYDWLHKRHALAILTLVEVLIVEPFTEAIFDIRAIPVTLLGLRYALGLLVFCGYVVWRVQQKEPQ